jgi:CBS domain containing-hemolysin-like protein
MIVPGLLFLVGLILSAFFSGTETGFYRMTRLRIVMEASTGDWASRAMLVLANQPSLFVATVLVGNNLANYLTSLAVVMGTHHLFPHAGALGDLAGPMLLAPIVFIGGELMPKNLFFEAPNRLMRRCSPAIIACVLLFSPLTVLLWLLSQSLKLLAGQAPQELRSTLARREVNELMTEGHEAGLLLPVQRALAQNVLTLAGRPVIEFATPSQRVARVTTAMSRSEMLRLAQRDRRTLLPMEEVRDKRRLIGFVRVVDLVLGDATAPVTPRAMIDLVATDTFLAALEKLDQSADALGRVVNAKQETVGFVTARELRLALFEETY